MKFDADRDDKSQGQESMPVRLAKPYGGDVYGFHFPLIQGTEVAIAFHEGEPDRPYIAHALHDSRHVDHVTEKNSTRNVIRTPTNNKLRMEDKRGEEHIKLSTEYGGKTQLNLGHNVDASRVLRGEGAELRTDKWVSIRGGAGVFISADKQPSAGDRMLAMDEAIAQLENALGIAKSLASAAESAQALPSDTGNQQTLNDALKDLAHPGMVLNAPQGVSISSPQAVRLSSGSASVGITGCAKTAGTPLSRFLALLPVMMLPGRTAEGMGALVRLLAPDTRATVYHHDRCRIPLKQPVAMSTCQPVSLKHRPVMGTHATDVNGQVLLRLSTDNPEEVRGWLPGGDLHADLMALLHVWLGAHLDVRMQLCVARHLLPDARLSCNAEQTAQVGRTAVLRPLNAQQNRNDIITIHLGRFQRVRENIQRRKNDEDGDYRW